MTQKQWECINVLAGTKKGNVDDATIKSFGSCLQ